MLACQPSTSVAIAVDPILRNLPTTTTQRNATNKFNKHIIERFKSSNFRNGTLVDEEVVGFDVAMNDVELVNERERMQQTAHDGAQFDLVESQLFGAIVIDDVRHAARTELHEDPSSAARLCLAAVRDDERRSTCAHQQRLVRDQLQLGFGLVMQSLRRNDALRRNMLGSIHRTERALADDAQQLQVMLDVSHLDQRLHRRRSRSQRRRYRFVLGNTDHLYLIINH